MQLSLLQARTYGPPELTSERDMNSLREIDRSCARVFFEMAKYLEAQGDESPSAPTVSIERPVPLAEETQSASGSLLSLGQELIKILVRMREEMLTVPLHVLVKGEEEPMNSRAQDLARRYGALDPNQPPAYRH